MQNRDKNKNRGDDKTIFFKDVMLHLWLFEDIYAALKTVTATCFCQTSFAVLLIMA